ncbi:MAG: LTA synthase family protein [Tuberibacillus sp.]
MTTKLKNFMSRSYAFYAIAVGLLWIKTYIVYQMEFRLGIDNALQTFLLFVNPISSSLFFLGIALFFKGHLKNWLLVIIDFILSLLLYANVVFYRFFDDFITVPVLFQHKNFGELGDSVLALMNGYDAFYFLDTLILMALIIFKAAKPQEKMQKRYIKRVFIVAIAAFLVNLGLAEIDRPGLLTRTFDRNYLVKYLGINNFTVYDVIKSTRTSAQRAMASSNDLVDAENFTRSNYTPPNPQLFGKAKGMNVIYISMESLQNFIINDKVDGEEVTPFLNSLTHDPNTFYFDNFFHQVGQGKTSDAEFMMENSLYPLSQGSVFMTQAQNTYQAAPQILKSKGYTSAVFHGNYKTFWNRDEMYRALGYDKFFDASYFDMSDENTINYGMKDKPMVQESMAYLNQLPEPFYAKYILLSNHFPFELDKGDVDFPAGHTDDKVVNQYYQTAHYMDEALKQFFDELKASGLYDHTVIVMYGDHYGISPDRYDSLSQALNEEITPYVGAQLQRVPLFIHVPGVQGNVVHQYGGEIDVRPTLLHLLGVNTKNYITFGSDLLSPAHRQIVPFRNGDVMTPDYSYIGDKCYKNPDGELVDNSKCQEAADYAKDALNLSDKIVYGDLLRFYTPKGFVPVDISKINYTTDPSINVYGKNNQPSTKTNATEGD